MGTFELNTELNKVRKIYLINSKTLLKRNR